MEISWEETDRVLPSTLRIRVEGDIPSLKAMII
jgi:hypothetical protein